jgi:hypothetical protein
MEDDPVNVRYCSVLFVYENDASALAEPLRAEDHVSLLYEIQILLVPEVSERLDGPKFRNVCWRNQPIEG